MPITPRSRFAIAKGMFLSIWTELRKDIVTTRGQGHVRAQALSPRNRPIKIAWVGLAQFDIGNLVFLLLLN
jgi:hypothetical protein